MIGTQTNISHTSTPPKKKNGWKPGKYAGNIHPGKTFRHLSFRVAMNQRFRWAVSCAFFKALTLTKVHAGDSKAKKTTAEAWRGCVRGSSGVWGGS